VFLKACNPIAVFRIMPGFWKVWLLANAAGMAVALAYLERTMVRVGR
jgi:hypothetical protein